MHGVDARGHHLLPIERGAAHQQFVEKDTEAVDVAACIDVDHPDIRLFRAHVGRGADKLVQLAVNGMFCQPALCRLGDAKVDDLGGRNPVDR